MPVQQRASSSIKKYEKATLYAFVFDSYTTKLAVLILFGFLLLQPLTYVYASTEETLPTEDVVQIVETPQIEVIVEEEIQEPPTEVAQQIEAVEDQNVVPAPDAQTQSEEVILDSGTSEQPQSAVEEVGTILPPTSTSTEPVENPILEEPTPDPAVDEITEDSATTTQATTTTVVSEEVPTEVPVEVSSTTSATTTVVQNPIGGHNASAFTFDTTQCATVGDGAYYCNDTKSGVDSYEDGVFAAPDADGDLEIYMRVGGEEAQITHNTIDDNAPYFDARGERIVWHSNIDDRYQIVSYNIESKEMLRFTSTPYNNMEPVAYGNVTLWQAWILNNWEIMLFDGETQIQLTNNTLQDVSPHMREGYIVWQTQFEDGWQVAVYNQETKHVEYIPSEGGLKVENPRFVLVYDSTNAQGDVQTVGYDFDSKSSFNLGVLPQELPDELPEPDQTGETRALIQNKQTTREGEQEVIDILPEPQAASSSTPEAHTLDLSLGMVNSGTATTSAIEDVVISSYTNASTTSQEGFAPLDLVIPPFSASTTEEVS